MDKSIEFDLIQAIGIEDIDAVSSILAKGANPNKIVNNGMTCLGEATSMGSIEILKLLISASINCNSTIKSTSVSCNRNRSLKCQKRKLSKHEAEYGESSVKCKNMNDDRLYKELPARMRPDRNQGYFVVRHGEVPSSEENRFTSLRSPLSPQLLTPSPQADLEWDEEIGNVAPTTSEDETWSSMYKWYAAILENTGAAIAAASQVSNGIDQQDAYTRTALHYAADFGHFEATKLLIEAGCKVDIPANNGLIPFHVAVAKNQLDIAKLLLESGSDVNYKTHDKTSPLHFAASRGYLDVVRWLLSNGAQLEARDASEHTTLYLAAGNGHVEVVKHLISCGANVNGEEIHGYTPLCEAVWEKYAPVVELLLNCGARITHSHKLLHHSIIYKQEEIVKLLINHGGGINLHNDSGDTPLLLAVRTSQPNIVRLLLHKGASANIINNTSGLNALHIAVESVEEPALFEQILVALIEYNIDMNVTALIGDTPLNWALLLHRDPASKMLIRHGADINACDLHNCNLLTASKRKLPNIARMLMKAGHFRINVDEMARHKYGAAKWLYQAYKQPFDLSDICRIKIRHMCTSRQLYRYINRLPLPVSVKRFLMMVDED